MFVLLSWLRLSRQLRALEGEVAPAGRIFHNPEARSVAERAEAGRAVTAASRGIHAKEEPEVGPRPPLPHPLLFLASFPPVAAPAPAWR